jgi:hypothetical protein
MHIITEAFIFWTPFFLQQTDFACAVQYCMFDAAG